MTKVLELEGSKVACVKMSDIGPLSRRLHIQVPLERIMPYLLPKKGPVAQMAQEQCSQGGVQHRG